MLIEQTSVGMRLELFAFQALQSVLSSFNSEELPVTVLDISNIKEKNGQIADLAKLQDITKALAEQRPSAIAIDVVLNPAEDDSTNKDTSAEDKIRRARDYYNFLDFCMKLKSETKIPIFLAIGERTYYQPRYWLGQEKYKELAATALIPDGDITKMPTWFKSDSEAEKLFSLSASLARAYTTPRLPRGMAWAVKATEEGLPGTEKELGEGVVSANAFVNYSKIKIIQQNKLLTLSGESVKDAGEKFRNKIVLLGDGTLEKAIDVFAGNFFNVPWQSEAVSGVYLHACAAYTFACKPLYEVNLNARLALDTCLSFLIFGGVAIVQYRHPGEKRDVLFDKHPSPFIYIFESVILLSAVVLVYWLGLLWFDFLLVAIALWLHPKFEKSIMRPHNLLSSNVPEHDESAATYRGLKDYDKTEILNLKPNDAKALNESAIIYHNHRDAERNPNPETEKTMNPQKRKILFIAANPSNASRVQTDKEHRIIKAEMERGSHRNVFEFLQPQLAVTITELLRAMNAKPNIVHFSGHGAKEGIVITKDDNKKQVLTTDILERLFKPLKGFTEIVVLNSCHSAAQAEFISELGMYVIGNNLAIRDDAAISFAKGLYNGLSEGKSFEDAINDARIVVMTESPDSSTVIEVWKDGHKLDI